VKAKKSGTECVGLKQTLSVTSIMTKVTYPNLKKEKMENFVLDLANLFPSRHEQTLEEKFITGVIRQAAQSRALPFLENNEDYMMQKNFLEFYCDGPAKFRNSMHTYDSEVEIQKVIKK
jgi:hypothetical protein